MRYAPPIRGKLNKKVYIPTEMDLGMALTGASGIIAELQQLREDLINTVNYKIQEVDEKLQSQIAEITDTTKILQETQREVINHIKDIKVGPAGKDADELSIARRVESRFPNTEKIEKNILSKIPKLDDITSKVLQSIPKNKASLKVIQEKFEVDPMSVIEKIMELPPEKLKKLKLKKENIDGLEQTMSAFNNQLGRGYLHGGGDTVTAGTNVTITTNTAGQKVISSTGGGGGGLAVEVPSGLVNGSNTSYTVTNLPLWIVADNQTYFSGKGYSISGTGPYTLTLDAAPWNFIESIYTTGSTTVSTPTGLVNGSNTVYTVATTPLYIVADNQTYFENFGYTRVGTTITMDVAPFNFIRAIN